MPDAYLALRRPSFRAFLGGSLLKNLSNQALTVTVAWHLYEQTGSAWALAAIGLANYLPIFTLSLPAGWLADHFERRRVLAWSLALEVVAALSLLGLAWAGAPLGWWYVLVFLAACGRAVGTPNSVSLYPLLMPKEAVPNAVTWGSATFQAGAVVGPILGGLILHATSDLGSLAFAAFGPLAFLLLLTRVRPIRRQDRPSKGESLKSRVLGGFRFVRKERSILAALSLDFVAVLFGGVEGIMPIFAKDFLHCGALGYGFLKAAPFAGALVMSVLIAHLAPMRRPGRAMLRCVAGFGLCMLVFAVSRLFWLSMLALLTAGLLDQISVYVRQTLVQTRTPEALRGRVQAVNFLFIGSSNELGEAESGVTAAILGPVGSVLMGGGAVLLVVALWSRYFPALRDLGPMSGKPRKA